MLLEQGLFKVAALVLLMAMAGWFTWAARVHFSKDSPRRPILFALEALSLAICLGTVWTMVFGALPTLWRTAVASLCGGAGGLLFASALRATSKRNFGVVFGGTVPTEIVDHGPYRFIRHPLYTSYLLNWIGCSFLSASPWVWLATGAIAVLYLIAARGEERDLLASPQGSRYAAYRRTTGLLLPRLRLASKS